MTVYTDPLLAGNFQTKFINALNMHRRLSVAAALDIAKIVSMDLTIGDIDRVLDFLVEKNLVSFSRTHELFYLGEMPKMDEKQQPLPAEMIERLMESVGQLKNEIADLKNPPMKNE